MMRRMRHLLNTHAQHAGIFVLSIFAGSFFYATLVSPNLASSQLTRYYIDYSLQFNSANSRYLSKVYGSVGSTTIWTFSAWVKRSSTGTLQTIFSADFNSSNYTTLWFTTGNALQFAAAGQGGAANKITTATYTSTTDWYHIVLAVDTSQGTAANKNRLYVNGTEVTAFSTNTNLGTGGTFVTDNRNDTGGTVTHWIGRWVSGNYFDGLMADVILVGGKQLTPSSFGYDDGGTWRPKAFTAATTTTNGIFGTNGFWLNFASSTRLGRDVAATTTSATSDFTLSSITSAQQSTTTPTGSLDRSSANDARPSGETYLTGPVTINGGLSVDYNLSKGAGTFVIDHPLDPKNKLLYHSFVESPDMKNIYDGIAELDGSGEASIELPGYFLALNEDYRYLATPIGEPMPNLFLSSEVRRKWFGLFGAPVLKISGGAPNGKISWQVTGIRHDLFATMYPIRVEVEKGPDELAEKGEYIHPHVYGQ